MSMMKHKTVKPGDTLSGKIPIGELYKMYQPGRYMAKISCGLNSGDKKSFITWWSDTLTSQEVSFEVSPPSPQQFEAMMDYLNTPITRTHKFDKTREICRQLGELQSHSAIEALKRLALYQPPKPVGREKSEKRQRIRRSALADDDPDVRRQARSCLYAVAEDIGIVAVTSMLDDPDVNVQKAAAYQLAFMGDAVGIHLIEQDLKANHAQIRSQARRAVSELYKQNVGN